MTDASFNVDNTPFEAIGGEERVRALVDAFYAHMGFDEAFAETRTMYPDDLTESKDKLFEFLVGWLGGPPLYVSKYGHPRLRMRHANFPINEKARDDWLQCMALAMDELEITGDVRTFLDARFAHVANFLRNVEG